MAFGQDAQIVEEMFKHPMLRPKLRGVAQTDANGNWVYPTGDVVSPGGGQVIKMGSQLREAVAELPDDRNFQKMAQRGKFGSNSMLTMLGASAGATMGGPGASAPTGGVSMDANVPGGLSRIRKAMEEGQGSGDYDEKGRRKTFQMLGSKPTEKEALEALPGVTLSDGSLYPDGTPRIAPEDISPEMKQKQMLGQVKALMDMAGDRSISMNPDSGNMSLGAAPRKPMVGAGSRGGSGAPAAPKPVEPPAAALEQIGMDLQALQDAVAKDPTNRAAIEPLVANLRSTGQLYPMLQPQIRNAGRSILEPAGIAVEEYNPPKQESSPELSDIPSDAEIQAAAGGNLTPEQLKAVKENYKQLLNSQK